MNSASHSQKTVPGQFASVRRWVARSLESVDHEDRVAEIATRLFELTIDRHRLPSGGLRLLRLAAMVHDVGRSVDDETHPRQGARMLLKEPNLPLNEHERRWLAYLTRYHRGAVPDKCCDGILHRSDPHDRLRMLLALLRTADALDSRSVESPRLTFSLTDKKLRIVCYLDDESPKASRIYTRRKKFRLLEEMLDVRVDVRIEIASESRAAAA
jgi:exopolyphosphatase / guanosine-5'-triphosphate,3'-diphosphate pyrophosphatase